MSSPVHGVGLPTRPTCRGSLCLPSATKPSVLFCPLPCGFRRCGDGTWENPSVEEGGERVMEAPFQSPSCSSGCCWLKVSHRVFGTENFPWEHLFSKGKFCFVKNALEKNPKQNKKYKTVETKEKDIDF